MTKHRDVGACGGVGAWGRWVWLTALASSVSFGQAAKPAERGFAQVVEAEFASWDADGNGEITADEIDPRIEDPAVKGERAAAAAAIKLTLRSTKIVAPKLTREYVTKHAGDPMPRAGGELENVVEPGKKSGYSLDARYRGALRKIRAQSRVLFRDPTPDLDKCRQGPLGDCFFVAPVGAFVERDHAAIMRMIVENKEPTGVSYTVTFPGHEALTVSPVTDGEIALTSSTGDEGVWLAVLEKAFGELRGRQKSAKAGGGPGEAPEVSTDAIAHGGTMGSAVEALTGHGAERLGLWSKIQKTPDAAGEVTSAARGAMVGALKAKRLVGASTRDEKLPPGVSPNHAYAILGFDEASDRVKLWNPHGNTFKPKGAVGIEHGYATKGGIFEVPLDEFVRVFSAMTVETDGPPKAGRERVARPKRAG